MSIQQYYTNHKANQPCHIYYDMNIINNDSAFPAQPVQFNYKETRSNNFLLSPQDYFMSIVRFNLQTPTLPIFIPQINLNTETNLGGVYPIETITQTPSTNASNPFTVNLFTGQAFPVGTVVQLKQNSLNNTVTEASGLKNAFFRVTNVVQIPGTVTQITLYNPAGSVVSTPTAYQGNNAVPYQGGTLSVRFGKLDMTNMFLDTTTNELGIVYTMNYQLNNLANVYQPGDIIYVENAGQYNGQYTISSITGSDPLYPGSDNVIYCRADALVTLLNQGKLNNYPYVAPTVNGGFFLPIGDYVNVTPYTVTMTFTPANPGNITYTATQALIYQSTDDTQPVPVWNPSQSQPLTLGELTSEYYWLFNYNKLMGIVNDAFTNAFWTLQAFAYLGSVAPAVASTSLPATDPSNLLTFQAPTMTWDSNTYKALITADNNCFNESVKYVKMYFNNAMSTLFDAFPYYYPNVPINSPLYSQVVFNYNSGAGQFIKQPYSPLGLPVTPALLCIQIIQDHQTASLMNPIQSIVFTSTLLPVSMENVGTPLVLNGANANKTILGSTANIFPIVTDFVVPFSAASGGYLPDVTYVPSGEYRFVDMYGTSPCKAIDISVFWKDLYGLLHPFLLGSGCSGSLKVLFRRKDFNDIQLAD